MAARDDDNMILWVFEQAEQQAAIFFHSNPEVRGISKQNTSDLFGFCLTMCFYQVIPISNCKEMQENAPTCPLALYINIIMIEKACFNTPLKSCNYSFSQLYSKRNKSSSDLQPGLSAATMAEFRGAILTA